MQTLLSSLGYKRALTARVYIGDFPAGSITDFSGNVSSATYTNTGNVARLVITHPAISYNYISFATMYANRVNTTDNDAAA